jgi:membrane-associated phospholipid phosphatase
MAIALILDLLITNCLLKNLVARTRPYDVANFTDLIVKKPKDYSFPSGHTAASFAAVTALFMRKEKLLGSIACVVAVFIAFSRMYLYVHFPTDILGGIVVGVASGVAAGFILRAIDKKLAARAAGTDIENQ